MNFIAYPIGPAAGDDANHGNSPERPLKTDAPRRRKQKQRTR